MYSRDTGRGNSREGGGEGCAASEGVYSRDTGRGNSREGGGHPEHAAWPHEAVHEAHPERQEPVQRAAHAPPAALPAREQQRAPARRVRLVRVEGRDVSG